MTCNNQTPNGYKKKWKGQNVQTSARSPTAPVIVAEDEGAQTMCIILSFYRTCKLRDSRIVDVVVP